MTASCVRSEHVDAFLDGDLTPAEASAFEAHLAACAACADELVLARRLQAGLRALPAEPCPDDVFDAALARIARLEGDRPALDGAGRGRAPRWRTAAGVGAALLALLVAALVVSQLGGEAPDTPLLATETPPATPTPPVVIEPPVQEAPLEVVSPPAFPAPRPYPPTRRRLASPAAEAPPEQTPVPDDALATDAAPSEAPRTPEAEAARDDALLALGLVADAHRDAREAVREGVRSEVGLVSDALALAFPD